MKKKSYSAQELQQAVAALKDEQTEELADVREMRTVAHVLLRREVRRLSAKLGNVHPRVRALEAGLKRNLDTIHELDVELEVARVRVPQIEETEALVHGRVMDQHKRGLAGLTVYLQDGRKQPLRFVENVTTDASGYFVLTINVEAIEKIAKKKVFLAFSLRTGRIVYRDANPLNLGAGKVIRVQLQLRRQDLTLLAAAVVEDSGAVPKQEPA